MTGAWGTGVIVTVLALVVKTGKLSVYYDFLNRDFLESKICETRGDSIFEEKGVISCPEPGDPDHFTDCCGPSWSRSGSFYFIFSL